MKLEDIKKELEDIYEDMGYTDDEFDGKDVAEILSKKNPLQYHLNTLLMDAEDLEKNEKDYDEKCRWIETIKRIINIQKEANKE